MIKPQNKFSLWFRKLTRPKWLMKMKARIRENRKQRQLIEAKKLILKASHPQIPGAVFINGERKMVMVENVKLDIGKNLLDFDYSRVKGSGQPEELTRKQRRARALFKHFGGK